MTDEITETGYTEGSYGLFGIAVFYVQNERDTIAYRRIIFYRQKCQLTAFTGDLNKCKYYNRLMKLSEN